MGITVMANETSISMIHQGKAAKAADHDVSTGAAHDEGKKAPAIEHEDHLMPGGHRVANTRFHREQTSGPDSGGNEKHDYR